MYAQPLSATWLLVGQVRPCTPQIKPAADPWPDLSPRHSFAISNAESELGY